MWGDLGRCEEIRGDAGRCGEIWFSNTSSPGAAKSEPRSCAFFRPCPVAVPFSCESKLPRSRLGNVQGEVREVSRKCPECQLPRSRLSKSPAHGLYPAKVVVMTASPRVAYSIAISGHLGPSRGRAWRQPARRRHELGLDTRHGARRDLISSWATTHHWYAVSPSLPWLAAGPRTAATRCPLERRTWSAMNTSRSRLLTHGKAGHSRACLGRVWEWSGKGLGRV